MPGASPRLLHLCQTTSWGISLNISIPACKETLLCGLWAERQVGYQASGPTLLSSSKYLLRLLRACCLPGICSVTLEVQSQGKGLVALSAGCYCSPCWALSRCSLLNHLFASLGCELSVDRGHCMIISLSTYRAWTSSGMPKDGPIGLQSQLLKKLL